jgi:hypothetical protein
LARIERLCIASDQDLKGCDEEEICALEERYQVRLPMSYRMYLRHSGHKSGKLFAHDHLDTHYRDVWEMTDEEPQYWREEVANFALPQKALLIAGRLAEQFWFIHCDGDLDSRVWYFNTEDWQICEVYASVIDWLESWCAEAEQINSCTN